MRLKIFDPYVSAPTNNNTIVKTTISSAKRARVFVYNLGRPSSFSLEIMVKPMTYSVGRGKQTKVWWVTAKDVRATAANSPYLRQTFKREKNTIVLDRSSNYPIAASTPTKVLELIRLYKEKFKRMHRLPRTEKLFLDRIE